MLERSARPGQDQPSNELMPFASLVLEPHIVPKRVTELGPCADHGKSLTRPSPPRHASAFLPEKLRVKDWLELWSPPMQSREQKLTDLGYPLDRVPKPGATYTPVVVDGTTAYVSGAVPFDGTGNLVSKGKVPSEVSLVEAQKAAALCAANLLRVLRAELGSLDRVERTLKLTGYVNSDTDFTEQHLVINGASELLIEVLGDSGRHARTAVGMAQLPLGASVEVDLVVKLKVV